MQPAGRLTRAAWLEHSMRGKRKAGGEPGKVTGAAQGQVGQVSQVGQVGQMKEFGSSWSVGKPLERSGVL